MKQMIKNWKIIESLHDWIFGNKTKKQIEIGVDLEVDGKIKVNGKENLTDKDGNPLDFGGESSGVIDSEEIVTNETEEGTELFLAQEISNKIQNSLQLPAEAPAVDKIVGIGTNGVQKLVDVPNLYLHKINVVGSDFDSTFSIYSNKSTPYTFAELTNKFKNTIFMGVDSMSELLPVFVIINETYIEIDNASNPEIYEEINNIESDTIIEI